MPQGSVAIAPHGTCTVAPPYVPVRARSALGGGWLAWLPLEAPPLSDPPTWFVAVVLVTTAVVLVLSWQPVRNMMSRSQRMNARFNPLHLVGTYGAFGSITRQRDELAIEGTTEADPDPDSEWREYGFRGKPGDPRQRPPQVAPYHLRLDWLMWFAALSSAYSQRWLLELLRRLLAGDRQVLRLLRSNPFPDAPPAAVRVVRYRYRFTTRQERRETGHWWRRQRTTTEVPPVALTDAGDLVQC